MAAQRFALPASPFAALEASSSELRAANATLKVATAALRDRAPGSDESKLLAAYLAASAEQARLRKSVVDALAADRAASSETYEAALARSIYNEG